jgi:hypothetical protein
MNVERTTTMMKALTGVLVLAAVMPAAQAEDLVGLHLRSKAAIATAAPHRSAPYVQPLGEPEREPLVTPRDLRQDESRSSCESSRALCYDPGSGRIVYKPARQYMPGLPGMQADSISVKRDKLVFKYTF